MAESAVKDIQSRAQTVLSQSVIFDLRGVLVEQHNGGLLISGSVSRFYYKQLAQELVLGVCRQVDLTNSIDVR